MLTISRLMLLPTERWMLATSRNSTAKISSQEIAFLSLATGRAEATHGHPAQPGRCSRFGMALFVCFLQGSAGALLIPRTCNLNLTPSCWPCKYFATGFLDMCPDRAAAPILGLITECESSMLCSIDWLGLGAFVRMS